jgi:diguanylate cyclase (GGDEF)-like protein
MTDSGPADPQRLDRCRGEALELRVAELLADPTHEGDPLWQALRDFVDHMAHQVARLERISPMADRSPSPWPERVQHISQRFDRQINRLEKAIRISDRYQTILNDLNRALEDASSHDSLTGLPNRSFMADCCEREDERLVRDTTTYCLLAIDADRFKLINDTYGHETGDQVLIALANSFQQSIREGDYCARWGGEEFLALLAGADLSAATRVADRLLANVRAIHLPHEKGWINPRVSIGIAQHQAGESYREVYRRADSALLEAKLQGRDRYVLDSPGGGENPPG